MASMPSVGVRIRRPSSSPSSSPSPPLIRTETKPREPSLSTETTAPTASTPPPPWIATLVYHNRGSADSTILVMRNEQELRDAVARILKEISVSRALKKRIQKEDLSPENWLYDLLVEWKNTTHNVDDLYAYRWTSVTHSTALFTADPVKYGWLY